MKGISKRKGGNQQLIAARKPNRLFVEHPPKPLACVEITPRVLYPPHVLEVEEPDVTVRQQRGIEGIYHERKVRRLAYRLIVSHRRREILTEIDRCHRRNPINPSISRGLRQRNRIVSTDAAYLCDQFAASFRRLNGAAIHTHTLLVRKQHSLASGACEVEALQSTSQSMFNQRINHIFVNAPSPVKRREHRSKRTRHPTELFPCQFFIHSNITALSLSRHQANLPSAQQQGTRPCR